MAANSPKATGLPTKLRDICNPVFDSRVWDDFEFRDDDIIIASWAKAGTTWVQQIVGQLIFNGEEDIPLSEISPWYECVLVPHERVRQRVRAQTHRRFLKTHLPLDAFRFFPNAKFIYCARDGRDAVWSLHNHHFNFAPILYAQINSNAQTGANQRFERATADVVAYFREWLARDGYPFWPFWEHVRGWWAVREWPNVMLIHFSELKRDMPEQIRRIARFLEIPIHDDRWPIILAHCTFEYMETHAQRVAPFGGAIWNGGAKTFMYKGTNGRWRDHLTIDDVCAYEERARAELGEECARWLATGNPLVSR